MKKRDFILAGLILMAAPMSAQQSGPVRTDQDSKQVFEQTFEDDFEAWSAAEVDTINGVFYYINGTTAQSNAAISKPWDGAEWKNGFLRRDTLIHLYNGVVQTDNQADIDSAAFAEDAYTIVDDGTDIERNQALSEYGIYGGKKFFRYSSGSGKKVASWSSGLVPEYRRNLFVRGLPIEDETSYRLTVYVKTTKMGGTTPTFRADVMRGYFASEKPFTMGLENDSRNNKFNGEFTYQKDDFEDGKWEKIVFMTYYLNDSIANNYMLSNGYWWVDEWKWHDASIATAVGTAGYDSLSFIRQPDKFFARLSFRSDSTVFEVDNLSLTKSWIGGVEHTGDMIRVDFGYQTNLGQLAKAAKDRNKIAAVELPGQYFTVWGKDSTTHKWQKVDIASAEYQGDGYMYMWTKPRVRNGVEQVVKFDSYDSVLVSFTNPDDPELMLKYNGSKFPKALDVEWIKAGKKVPDFSNEYSIKNPNIANGVYSMKNLPPVLQECLYEEGSFNLDGNLREFSFKFSRPVLFDKNADESTELAVLHVVKGGTKEVWFVSGYAANDSILTFVRPAKYTEPLAGDYEFRLLQLKGKGTVYSNGGAPIVVNYSFGKAETPAALVDYIDFNSMATSDFTTESCALPGFSSSHCTSKVGDVTGLYKKGLFWGLYGKNNGASNNANDCAKLFFEFEIAEAGDYDIIFGETGNKMGSYNDDCREVIFLYNADGDEETSLDRAKTGYTPNIAEEEAVTAIKIDTLHADELVAGKYKIAFTLPNEGTYGGSHKGGKILYFIQISKKDGNVVVPSSYATLKALKNAQVSLNALIAKAEETAAYKGGTFTEAKAIATKYANFTDTKPSAYAQATASLTNAATALDIRFKTVDSLRVTAYEAGTKFLTDKAELAEWAEMKDLKAFLESVAALNYANYAPAYIREKIAYINTKMSEISSKEGSMKFAASQLNELVKVANTLGVVFPDADKDEIASRVERAQLIFAPDDKLVDIYKKAIVAKLYSKIAKGEKVDSLPLTAFISNPGLFATPKVVDRHDKSMPSNAGDLKVADENGAQIMLVNHQYNNIPICILIIDQEFTDLLPGWTVKSVDTGSGNRMVTVDKDDYARLKAGEAAFDGNLAMDWNSKAELKTTIAGLPTGYYTLGCELADNTGKSTTLSAKAKRIIDEDNDKDSTYTKALEAKAKDAVVDSIKVDYGTMDINLTLTSGDGWSKADNFYLIFKADSKFDYAGSANDADALFKQALTFVNDIEAVASKVEYYSINGAKINAPAKGAVNIKVTTLGDGTRLVQKILVK